MFKKYYFKKYYDVISYAFFGILTTLVNTLAYYLCYEIIHIPNVPSTFIAWLLAVIFAFITNKLWVFDSPSFSHKVLAHEIPTFFGARIATGMLDVLIMFLAVDVMAWPSTIWKLVSNGIVIVLNYIASKLVIFRKGHKMKRFSYRQLNTDYGSYFPGFFVMRLNHAIPFHNDKVEISDFTVENFATFAHEYIHYLQDISTTRGLNSLVYVDKLLQLNFNIIATSPENVIELPLDLENLGVKNLYEATQLESFYMGDDRPLFKIHHVNRVEREVEIFLDGITSDIMYDINIYFDDKDCPYLFGRDAVAESMAYTLETEAFKSQKRTNELPYNACELVCQQICPQLLQNKAVFVAAMELSLMHYHSGDMFWHIANRIKNENLQFNSVSEFETYFLDKTAFAYEDMLKEYQEAYNCVDVIFPKSNPAFDEVREFVRRELHAGVISRKQDGLFIAKILEAKNPYQTLCDYMSKYGMPIMCDSTYGMYGTTLTGNITALLAPLALYNVFMGNGEEANGCFMYPYCKAGNNIKQCNERECTKHPWTQADKDERETCLFGAYWQMYSLGGKKVVRKQ